MSKKLLDTVSFSTRDPKFPTMIANKYGASTEDIHKLNTVDTQQCMSRYEKKLRGLKAEGQNVRLMVVKGKGPVFAAYTNKEFDIFGFCKVIIDDDVVQMVPFFEKNFRLF